MKLSACFIVLAATLASVSAHATLKNPLPRGHPLNPNSPVKDPACATAPLNGGPGCSPKPFPCGGYPVDTKVTQVFKAGEVINVSFWNPNFPDGPKPGSESRDQARHNGGLCEFSLSYDGGVTYSVIATYHQTCPDIFFEWKVKIPDNAPSCDNPGKCIFSWSWVNALGNREFYHNCADVKISGTATAPLPIKDITRANLPPLFPQILSPSGDPTNNGNGKGSGPLESDVLANLAPQFGGAPGASNNFSANRTNHQRNNATRASSTADGQFSKSTPVATIKEPANKSVTHSPTNKPPTTKKEPPIMPSTPCTNGEMACVAEGRDSAFNTCTNGKLVQRTCSPGTVCRQFGSYIRCSRPKRRI